MSKSKTILKIILGGIFFIGILLILGYLGVFNKISESLLGANARDAVKDEVVYNIQPSKTQPGTFTFDYVFDETIKPPKGEVFIGAPIVPFDDEIACRELQENYPGKPCDFGTDRDAWYYPVHESAFINSEKEENTNKKTSFNPLQTNRALAYDVDSSNPAILNCRANYNVTGYFKAYFEDVELDTGVGFDDPDYGPGRRAEACQALQDLSELIKLDDTALTPGILFENGALPGNSLAFSSVYRFCPVSLTVLHNGYLWESIVNQDTEGFGPNAPYSAFIRLNFNNIDWTVDGISNNAYDLHTVISHEMLHSLGMQSLIPSTINISPVVEVHNIFDLFLYRDETVNEPFIEQLTSMLQAPVGAPSPWFISNDAVYQGVKNIPGAQPDEVIPVYSPNVLHSGSLSHFDANRSVGQEYMMHPSIGPNETRAISESEKKVLCHLGYQVEGESGCGLPTPLAEQDGIGLTTETTSVCMSPLSNDVSFAGGSLSIHSIDNVAQNPGDTLTYYTSSDCTTGQQSTVNGAQSILLSSNDPIIHRSFLYTTKDSVANRISFPTKIEIINCPVDADEYICNGDFELGSLLPMTAVNQVNYSNHLLSCSGAWTPAAGVPWWCGGLSGLVGTFPDLNPSQDNLPATTYGEWPNHFAMPSPPDPTIDMIGNSLYAARKISDQGKLITKLKEPLEIGEQYELSFDMFAMPITLAETPDDTLPVLRLLVDVSAQFDFSSSASVINQVVPRQPYVWRGITKTFTASQQNRFLSIESKKASPSLNQTFLYIDNVSLKKIEGLENPNTIKGSVYYDINENGVIDNSEFGVEGVQVKLFQDGNPSPVQVLNTQNVLDVGEYTFENLVDGTYYIALGTENTFNDITQPVANNGVLNDYDYVYDVSVSGGQTVSGRDFGVVVDTGNPTGQISGSVYYDANTNASLDSTESNIANVSVNLYDGDSGSLLQTQTTSNLGEYEFTALSDGDYYIAASVENNYPIITQPSSNPGTVPDYDYVYEVTIASGQPLTDKDFGAYEEPDPTGQISGTVYFDDNQNSNFETSEDPLASGTVDLFNQNSLSTPVQTASTSNLGEYEFTTLPDGTYYVATASEDDYSTTTQPVLNSGVLPDYDYVYEVVITNGQTVNEKDFGVYNKAGEGGVISGKVYYDQNFNGDFDAGDYGLGGHYVKLYEGNSLVQAAETWLSGGQTGNYTFYDVSDGNYIAVLSEEDNYPTVTEPGSTIDLSGGPLSDYDYVYFVTVSGGQSISGPITGVDFGVTQKRKLIKPNFMRDKYGETDRFRDNDVGIVDPGKKGIERFDDSLERKKKGLGAWLFRLFQ